MSEAHAKSENPLAGPTIAEALASGRDSFGIVRLALALAVVLSHAGSVTTGHVDGEPLVASTGFTLGEHAVNGFFAVSGFLVAMSFDRRGLKAYAVARSLRILPGLIVATLVVALLLGAFMTTLNTAAYYGDAGVWRFIGQTLTTFKSTGELPGVFQSNPFRFPMGTVWTLKYEIYCYIGLALAGAAGLFSRRTVMLAAMVALAIAIMALDFLRPEAGKGLQTSLRLPLIFGAGSCLYLYREAIRLSWAGVALGLFAAILTQGTFGYKAVMFLAETYAVLVCALGPGAGASPEPKSDLSYGVYLYGWPVQQALHALFPLASAGLLLVPSLILTLLVAAASWHGVEKPALGFKAGLLKRFSPRA